MLQVTDRVPTYAGRIQLIVVDEANGIYDMVRADEPTVVGTPLNAALFNSIAADLANIAPPILGVAENVANSKNVAFYSSLGATGLESDASVTTDGFISSALPLNSGVFCSVITGDTITLSDLPETQGTLLLMKGESADNRSGLFCPLAGGLYIFADGAWVALVTHDEYDVTTTDLVIDWTNGKITETLSDGTTVEHEMTIGSDGIPTKIGNMTLTISGVE